MFFYPLAKARWNGRQTQWFDERRWLLLCPSIDFILDKKVLKSNNFQNSYFRKVKVGKIAEAVGFVKNGVTRLCQAGQFASASDAAMSIFEYANKSNFAEMKDMFSQLLNSKEAQYWRNFLNEMGKA